MYRIIGADGREYGPISTEQMRQWIAEGRLNDATQVLAEGGTEWKPLAQFPEFGGALPLPGALPPSGPPAFSMPSPGTPSTADVSGLVTGPAIGLIITAALAVLANIAGLLVNIFGASLLSLQGMQGGPNDALASMMQGTVGVISSILGIVASGFVLLGGFKMLKLQSYTLAMVASIVAMIPCFVGFCCLIGLPVGIWALVVLNKPEVKSAFKR